jgi:NAD(P)-dependent dehydrogenase (short-subunit alcohol dehydrogenase family)
MGGQGIAIQCDHRDDAAVAALFGRISHESGRLDILVNNAWGGYENMAEQQENGEWEFTWGKPFWEHPLWRWEAMLTGSVRAAYVASQHAARFMLGPRSGLIVNISFWAARKYMGNVAYGVAKAAIDKMTHDMAHELRPHGVAVVSLYPGLVRTESVLRASEFFDLSNSESPQFIGRAVAALASDPNVLNKSGQVLVAAALALEYGFTDIDGKQPRPVTLEEA